MNSTQSVTLPSERGQDAAARSDLLLGRFANHQANVGAVGLPLSLCACAAGFRIVDFDINPKLVEGLSEGQSLLRHIGDDKIAAGGAVYRDRGRAPTCRGRCDPDLRADTTRATPFRYLRSKPQEAVKLTEDIFRALNIALVDELKWYSPLLGSISSR
jgi:hypothetical protein